MIPTNKLLYLECNENEIYKFTLLCTLKYQPEIYLGSRYIGIQQGCAISSASLNSLVNLCNITKCLRVLTYGSSDVWIGSRGLFTYK